MNLLEVTHLVCERGEFELSPPNPIDPIVSSSLSTILPLWPQPSLRVDYSGVPRNGHLVALA